MTITHSPGASRWMTVIPALPIAAVAVAGEIALDPLLAQATYHVLLGAVALGVLVGGVETGVLTLLLCGAGKFFLLAHAPGALPPQLLLAHMTLFGSAGALICAIGGDVQTSHRNLSAVLTSTSEAIIATDGKGSVQFLNPVAEMLTGWPTKAAAGKPVNDILRFRDMHTGQLVPNPALTALDLSTPMDLAAHTMLESRGGHRFPVAGRIAFVHGVSRSLRGTVIVMRDLSRMSPFRGVLPICARCKRIRDGDGGWRELERYLTTYSSTVLSHGLCPDCVRYYEQMP